MIDEISDQLQKVLSGLTDFQRATVDSVLEKYRLAEHSHRALVLIITAGGIRSPMSRSEWPWRVRFPRF